MGIASVALLVTGCAFLQPTQESLGVFQARYRTGTADVTVALGGTAPTRLGLTLDGRAGYLDEHMGVSVTWANEDGWRLSVEGTATDADVTLRSPDGIVGSGTLGEDCDLTLEEGMPATFSGTVECRESADIPPDETDHDFSVTFRAGPSVVGPSERPVNLVRESIRP